MSDKAYTNLQIFIVFLTFSIISIFVAVKTGELAVQTEVNRVAIEAIIREPR